MVQKIPLVMIEGDLATQSELDVGLGTVDAQIADLRTQLAILRAQISSGSGGTVGGGSTGGTGTGGSSGDTSTPPGTLATPTFDNATLSVVLAAITGGTAGGKRTAGWNAASARFSTNWNIVLRQNGTVKYRVKYSSAFSVSSSKPVIPATPDTTTTNTAADITSGTWTFAIEKDGDAATYLLATAGAPGSGAKVILAESLDGSKTVDFSALSFTFPASLDVTAADTVISETDPRILAWIKADKPWNAALAGTKFDFRIQCDHQYTASDQLITDGTTWNGIKTVRTADRITYNGIDLLRRYTTEPAFSGGSVGNAGGVFYMRLQPPVAWDADPSTRRSILSTMGNVVAYNQPHRFVFTAERLPSAAGIFIDLAAEHYEYQAPGRQQPFDLYFNEQGVGGVLVTWGADSTPAAGVDWNVQPSPGAQFPGQNNVWQTPLFALTLVIGHRYTFEVQARFKNDSSGYLIIWVRSDGNPAQKWIEYYGPIGWPGGSGRFGPKVGLYDFSGSSGQVAEITSDGMLVLLDSAANGYPALTTDLCMDTMEAA